MTEILRTWAPLSHRKMGRSVECSKSYHQQCSLPAVVVDSLSEIESAGQVSESTCLYLIRAQGRWWYFYYSQWEPHSPVGEDAER